jgi:hypothetical protein
VWYGRRAPGRVRWELVWVVLGGGDKQCTFVLGRCIILGAGVFKVCKVCKVFLEKRGREESQDFLFSRSRFFFSLPEKK